MPSNLESRLHALGLTDTNDIPNSSLTDQDSLIKGLIEEIVNRPVNSPLPQSLHSLGYVGDTTDFKAVSNFLMASVQAHRILSHHPTDPTKPSPDCALATHTSRLCRSLDVAPWKTPRSIKTPTAIAIAIDSTEEAMNNLVSSPISPLIAPILTYPDRKHFQENPAFRLQIDKILLTLQKEHVTRIGLLLTRLQVTSLSFSRSEQAQADISAFAVLARRADALQALWRYSHPVTPFQVLMAPLYLLADISTQSQTFQLSSDRIKQFVMGTVPDRGGRLSNQTEMPQFQERKRDSVLKDSTGLAGKGYRQSGGQARDGGKKRKGRQ